MEMEMRENNKIELMTNTEKENSKIPLKFISGGIWKMGKEYFLKRSDIESYLLLYTISGEGYLFYEGQEYQLLPEMAFLIDCRLFHFYRTATDNWEFAFIHFKTDYIREYVDDLYRRYSAVFRIADGKLMESKMRSVISGFQGYQKSAMHQAFGLIAQLLGMLYTAVEGADNSKQISEYTDSVIRIIEVRYFEKLTLDIIAKETGLSKYYLAHQFRTDMGLTIYGYLTLFRISKSKLLLQNTNMSVADISEQVGFNGVSNFIRTFSKYEEMTPHQYRKQWR